jgi:hypothetical protein
MATNTTENIALSLTLDGVEYQCQIIDATATLPGEATGDVTEVACPDGKVVEKGEQEDGSLSGTVFADSTDTGITWALMQAKASGAQLDYVLTWFANEDATVAFVWTGIAQVGAFSVEWAKPGLARHPIDLALLSVTISRPTP